MGDRSGGSGYRGSRRVPRAHKKKPQGEENSNIQIDENSPVLQEFQKYQTELDQKYDKYERLVKHSRDVTIESKRVIFLLHRITGESDKDKILPEAEKKIREIQATHLREIATELKNLDFYNYLRSFSPGLQEYVEAVTLYEYIKDGRLASPREIQDTLVFEEQPEEVESDITDMTTERTNYILTLTPLDYMLGVADLTGELMRKCINAVSQGNLEEPFVLCKFLQQVHTEFLSFGNTAGKEMTRKVYTLFQSVKKCENACYTIVVRGSEIPKHMLADVFSADFGGQENVDFD